MSLGYKIEQAHEILALFALRKFILQTPMPSPSVVLDVWFLVWPVVYFPSLCVRTVKALARLGGRAGSPEPSLVTYVISTKISWAGSNVLYGPDCRLQFDVWITSVQHVWITGYKNGKLQLPSWREILEITDAIKEWIECCSLCNNDRCWKTKEFGLKKRTVILLKRWHQSSDVSILKFEEVDFCCSVFVFKSVYIVW